MGNPTEHSVAPSTKITLTITVDQLTGETQVNGPIANAMLCYGMLEAAKDAVRRYVENLAKNATGIVGAHAMPPNMRQQ